jgi:hypothetical protein
MNNVFTNVEVLFDDLMEHACNILHILLHISDDVDTSLLASHQLLNYIKSVHRCNWLNAWIFFMLLNVSNVRHI